MELAPCNHRRSKAYNRNDYSGIVPIVECKLKIAAELEMKVKLRFINDSLGNYTEVFDINLLNDVISYINSLLTEYGLNNISSTTIEKVMNLSRVGSSDSKSVTSSLKLDEDIV